jgi:quinol monooxygenase YgiN
VENPLRLVFLKKWLDQASVDAHFSVPESGAFVREVTRLSDPLLPPTLEVFEVVPHR